MQYVLLVFQFSAVFCELALIIRLYFLTLASRYPWFVGLLAMDGSRNLYHLFEVLHWIPASDRFWLICAPFFWITVAGATAEAMQKIQSHVIRNPNRMRVLPWVIRMGYVLLVPLATLLMVYLEDPKDTREAIRSTNAIIFTVAATALMAQRFFLSFARVNLSHNALIHQWCMMLLLACESLARIAAAMHASWASQFLEAAAFKDVCILTLLWALKLRRHGEHVLEPMMLVPEGIATHARAVGHRVY